MIFCLTKFKIITFFIKKKNLYKIKIHDFKISSSNSKKFFYKIKIDRIYIRLYGTMRITSLLISISFPSPSNECFFRIMDFSINFF